MKQKSEKKNFLVLGIVAVIVSVMLLASMPTASAKLYGDANGDGAINEDDMTYVEQIIAGEKPETELADANQDGEINRVDVAYIERIILENAPHPSYADKCSIDVIPSISTPPLAMEVSDPTGDFFLDHPMFEETFDVVYESNEVIPLALDIIEVEVSRDDDYYSFRIHTAGDNLRELLQEESHSVRFGVYVDKDLNGLSDVLLTTTDQLERGVVITSDFEVIEDMPRLTIEDNSVTMSVSRDIVGDHFDWIVISGYSPLREAYCNTPLAAVFYVPVVDIAFAGPDRSVDFSDSFSQSNQGYQQCQQQWTGVAFCPPKGNPPGRTNIGPGLDGWLIKREQCGNRAVDWWCYGSQWDPLQNRWTGGAFGKRVFENTYKGWIARCPFVCGLNKNTVLRDSSNTKIIKVYHTIIDADCPQPPQDSDGDLRRDIMSHEYQFATNTVTSCNIERNQSTNAFLDKRCLSPKPPYTSPWSVPGSIP